MNRGLHGVGRQIVLFIAVLVGLIAEPTHAEVRVRRVTGLDSAAPVIGLQEPYMKKFLQMPTATPDRVVRVIWDADQGVPAGAFVIFEYRTSQGRDKVRYVKTERPSRGLQETVLRFDEADEIVAWRVRVMHGVRTLAAQTSANWR